LSHDTSCHTKNRKNAPQDINLRIEKHKIIQWSLSHVCELKQFLSGIDEAIIVASGEHLFKLALQ
jgi:hypothetical protein